MGEEEQQQHPAAGGEEAARLKKRWCEAASRKRRVGERSTTQKGAMFIRAQEVHTHKTCVPWPRARSIAARHTHARTHAHPDRDALGFSSPYPSTKTPQRLWQGATMEHLSLGWMACARMKVAQFPSFSLYMTFSDILNTWVL